MVDAERFAHVTLLTLRGVGETNHGETHRLLAPFDHVQPRPRRTRIVVASRQPVLRVALRALTAAPRWLEPWTSEARIDWRDWQWQPAAAVLRGATRVLLADAVGLGKTIQAALIIAELTARGFADRVLILAPASLREQWARELSDKFHISATVFDHAALAAMTAALPLGVNPWSVAAVIISSIDLVKRPEVRSALDSVAFDVIVVDEAHHLAPGSDRGAVVADLAARTPWVVLATATPHSGDEAAHIFLRQLGDVAARNDLVIFRRAAAEVVTRARRRTTIVAVRPTASERRLLDATMNYVRRIQRNDHAGAVGLVAAVIARRAASSATAARMTLTRRLQLLTAAATPEPEPVLPWDEGDTDGDLPDALLAVPGLSDRDDERRCLERLIELAHDVTASSKARVVSRLLRRTREPMILFSEYRDVVHSIASGLAVPVATLHGGMTAQARTDAIDAFTTGRVRVLAATDAAGEGLNLHQRCRLVVNVELPWNPQRTEQRVGRVDRIGQTRVVHVIHLVHRGSYEGVVIARHERRRSLALAALSRMTVSGRASASPAANHSVLTVALPRTTDTATTHLVARQSRRRGPAAAVVALFCAEIVDGDSRLIERALIPLHVALITPRRCLTKSAVRQLIGDAAIAQAMDRALADCLEDAHRGAAGMAEGLSRRCADMVAAIDRRQGPLVQTSLFDRRQVQAAAAQADARLIQRTHLSRRRARADAMRALSARPVHLVAAWLAD